MIGVYKAQSNSHFPDGIWEFDFLLPEKLPEKDLVTFFQKISL